MVQVHRAEALRRVGTARSGHLGTVRADGRPHVVVVTFALVGDAVVTAIDHKPKKTERLQRLINLEHRPDATFLVDHYEDDWDRLWWVRIDGEAAIFTGGPERDQAIAALQHKYADYRDRAPQGPVISLSISRITSWGGDS